MNQRLPFLSILFLLITGTLSAQQAVPKDTFDITRSAIQFPHPHENFKFQVSVGLSMVRPPKDLLENAIQAPLGNVHAIFGLPCNFSLEGDLTTIIVSNQLTLGPHYSLSSKNFGIKPGWDISFVYGQLKQAGFNNSMRAWMQYPNLSLGYKLGKISFTLKGELVLVTRADTKTGENQVVHSKNFFNGGTLAIYIEQRIHKNKVFVIGIKDNYEKLYWPTWMLFSTFNRYYHIPELNFSWALWKQNILL